MTGIGIIGAGHFGAVHARAMREVPGLTLVASCREDAAAAQAFATEHGGRAYSNWRALLDDKNVDAVVIATPHHLHEELAIGAAKAGKHILLEKPMAPSLAACDAINTAVAASGVKLLVGHVMHFALPCLVARDIIASGRYGKPRTGSSWMIKLWMESNRRPWHLSHETGGGMLMTAGIHALDRLIWLMDQNVTGVTAMADALFHDQQADDTALIGLRFEGGGLGQVQSIGYRDGAMTFAMEIVCETAAIRVDFDRGVSVGQGGVWTDIPNSIEPDWMHHAVAREWADLHRAIETNTPTAVTGDYARHVVAVVDAAHRANRDRREVIPQ